MENSEKTKKALIDSAVIVGTSTLGLMGANAAENNLDGYIGPGVATGAGVLTLAFAPKWAKPAGGVLTAYGVFSGIKKLVFKPNKRRTGLLAEVEEILPGYMLPAEQAPTTQVATTVDNPNNTLRDKIQSGIQRVKLSLGMKGLEEGGDMRAALAGASINGLDEALTGQQDVEIAQALAGKQFDFAEVL